MHLLKFIQEEMPDPLTDFTIGAYIIGSRYWHGCILQKKAAVTLLPNSGREKLCSD
jgi:hypothetical protein